MPRSDDDEPLAHPHDPRVRAVIRAVLLDNRWPRHDVETGIDNVELEAWDAKPRPTTLGGWKALGRTVAKKRAIDRIRSEKVGGKASERPTDRADEHLSANSGEVMETRMDRQRALAEMRAVASPEELPVFDRLALGHDQKEIGEQLGLRQREVSRRVASMRERFQKLLGPAALVALLAVVAGYFVFRKHLGPDDQAQHEQPSATSAPTAPPGPSPEQLAQQQDRAHAESLRQLATADCIAGKWTACQADLESASQLDPDGDRQRRVKRLKEEARQGLVDDDRETKLAPGARGLSVSLKSVLVGAIEPSRGQGVVLACASAPEPSQLCDQLVAAFKSAGWKPTRTRLATTDAGVTHGILVEVATDADDPTQDAANQLVFGLNFANLFARGPHDLAPGGDGPLRVTVGPQ